MPVDPEISCNIWESVELSAAIARLCGAMVTLAGLGASCRRDFAGAPEVCGGAAAGSAGGGATAGIGWDGMARLIVLGAGEPVLRLARFAIVIWAIAGWRS